ncbi:glycoside hydrolase family 15 protein [Trametes punicea]|nr:glycoside hydrolase family 15 protein [Trametes punicea]
MSVNVTLPQKDRGYIPISDHGLIGNLRTAALISVDGSVESYCVPDFDSPSIFVRILDKDKGGHFSINPTKPFTTKQNYLPESNVIRGSMDLRLECAPAFNYARSAHTTSIVFDDGVVDENGETPKKAQFRSSEAKLDLDLRYVTESTLKGIPEPEVQLNRLDLSSKGHKGPGVWSKLSLLEGQAVTFVLMPPSGPSYPALTKEVLRNLFNSTNNHWKSWIRRSTYKGSWKEAVLRSALALKLLIYEPTGAVVASPTFSLPETIGGTRNWDYRASWIRDSSFTLHALIRLGFTEEAHAYMEFIFDRIMECSDGSLKIMYTIHGTTDFPEEELNHLDGYKSSRPVRIGNGAIDQLQLDIYGELLDCIYLSQKYGRPLSLAVWNKVREIINYVVQNTDTPDVSIWEPRGGNKNFTYSKVMMWVAIDRGIRLSEQRSLPCQERAFWYQTRDDLREKIAYNAWDEAGGFFAETYEQPHVLDAALLIMPIVFFASPTDPQFLSTLNAILRTPENGGLTVNGLVYRYDTSNTDDGFEQEPEGTFSLCTLWCVEALARAGRFDEARLDEAVTMFEDFLQYSNHVGLYTEEISPAGVALGNAVQGLTLISAASNLSRILSKGSIHL